MSVITNRPLSRHERFSLVRDHIGSKPLLTYVAAFRPGASIPTVAALQSRMALLVAEHPILSCRVADAWTKHPTFEHSALDEKDIAKRISASNLQELSPGKYAQQTILELCTSWEAAMDTETGDLWRIGIFTDDSRSNQTYLAICIHHVLTDAKGFLPAIVELLSTEPLAASHASPSIPPALETAVKIKPAFTTLLEIIIKALLVPKLPTWLVPSFLRTVPLWPYISSIAGNVPLGAAPAGVSPLKADIGVLTGSWSADHISQLRALLGAGQDKTPSLQTIFTAFSVAALYITEGRDRDADPHPLPMNIKVDTPTSERKAECGHPVAFGNYVGALDQQQSIADSTTIGDIVRAYHAHISSSAIRKTAPTVWGLFDFIDDPEAPTTESGALTGWEKFFVDKATGKEPLSASIEVSNIGVLPVLPPDVQSQMLDFHWMQVPQPAGPAICLNVIGLQPQTPEQRFGDLNFTVTWRIDAAPGGRLSRERMEHLVRQIQRLPEKVLQLGEEGGRAIMKDLLKD